MKSGLALALFCIAIAIVVGYRFDQYLLQRNYLVDAHVPCDPATERCFVSDCSPANDPECDTTPYKKVEIKAADAPACVLENSCKSFSCSSSSCHVTTCSEDVVESGETCAPTP